MSDSDERPDYFTTFKAKQNHMKNRRVAGIVLMIIGLTITLNQWAKTGDRELRTVDYVLFGAAAVLFVCGVVSLVNAMRKEKEGTRI